MDLARKLELAETLVRSIAEHDDAPAKDVEAALARVAALIRTHGAAAKARRDKKQTGQK